MPLRRALLLTSLLTIVAAACGDDDSPTDGGGTDGGASDGGASDGGASDAPPADAPPGAETVTVRSADDHPLFAARDGDSAWAALAPGAVAERSFTVTGERYAIAFACVSASTVSVNVIAATVTEGTEVEVDCATGPTGEPPGMETLVTVGGTVSGLPGSTSEARVHIAGRSAMPTGAMPTWSLDVPPGTRDVFALRMTTAPRFDRVIRQNDVALAAGTDIDFDFGSGGFAPETHAVTVEGASGTDTVNVRSLILNRAGGSPFMLTFLTDGTYLALPTSELRGEDVHSVTVGIADAGAGTYRTVRRLFVAAEDFTATLPTLPPAPTVTAAARTPYLQPEATLPSGVDADWVNVTFTQNETMPETYTRAWSASLTRGWISDAAATSWAIPDLSSLSGYDTRWGLVDGNELQWQQFHFSTNEGSAPVLDAVETTAELDGREELSTQRLARVTL